MNKFVRWQLAEFKCNGVEGHRSDAVKQKSNELRLNLIIVDVRN